MIDPIALSLVLSFFYLLSFSYPFFLDISSVLDRSLDPFRVLGGCWRFLEMWKAESRWSSVGVLKERGKYPIRAEDYELLELVGDGASASVHRARCIPFDEIVAIKILDCEKNTDLSNISREAQTMILIDHPNVLKAHCSFVIDHNLWVVMPYMAGGSCFHIMKSSYPNGFEEVVIATILREVLKGLEYLHRQGHIHRDVKAGNILVDARRGVKLGDFGVSAYLFDSGDRQRTRNTFVGTPCWMAPEVMEQRYGYDFKADIWSFGITAWELAHGHAPFSSQSPLKVLLMTLRGAPPSLVSGRDKKFSKSFEHMIAMCLVKDPTKRPTACKLLKQSFFKQAKSHDYIARKILADLPSLVNRFHSLKLKEAELLAQKKMLDGEKEEMSQNEYKRGVSSWNFNVEDLKAQALLIPNEDAASGKVAEGRSSSLFELDTLHENVLQGVPGLSITDSFSSSDQPGKFQRAVSDVSDNESKVSVSSLNSEPKVDEWHMDNVFACSYDEHEASTSSCLSDIFPSMKQESVKQHNEDQGIENCNGRMSHAITDNPPEAMPKLFKSTASNGDIDEKLKATVVEQRGRFKVTSETVELDKVVVPSPSLTKSYSMQQGNILGMMKQASTENFTDNHTIERVVTASTTVNDKSLLQAAGRGNNKAPNT